VLALIPLAATAYLIINHYNDAYIVTNRRVLHIERHFVTRELQTEAPLHTIQDIHQRQLGPLANLLNFGDLHIETAGERGQVVFRQIPDPSSARAAIFDEIDRVRSATRVEERAAIRSVLQRQLGPEPSEEQTGTEAIATGGKSDAVPAAREAGVHSAVPSPLRDVGADTVTWHKHWAGLIRELIVPTLGILLATAIAVLVMYTEPPDSAVVLLAYGVVLAVLVAWWAWRLTDWRNDVYQVTAARIIDIERRPFSLSEERREASLNRVQSISLTIPGVIGRMLNYGSVTIETAGEGAFTFEYVKDPRGVQAEVFRRIEAFQRRQREQDAERRRIELLDWFAVYDQIRDRTQQDGTPVPPPTESV
jgi:uncharacterized membrane protein YdbT with pleckstrin-like domain